MDELLRLASSVFRTFCPEDGRPPSSVFHTADGSRKSSSGLPDKRLSEDGPPDPPPGSPGSPRSPGSPGSPGFPGSPGLPGSPGFPGSRVPRVPGFSRVSWVSRVLGVVRGPGFPGSPGFSGSRVSRENHVPADTRLRQGGPGGTHKREPLGAPWRSSECAETRKKVSPCFAAVLFFLSRAVPIYGRKYGTKNRREGVSTDCINFTKN